MEQHRTIARRPAIRTRWTRIQPLLEQMESRRLLTNFVVTSTSDTPVAPTPDVPFPLTLRQAITEADANPGPDTISFDLVPKNIPGVVDFDLVNQVWRIHVDNNNPLPPITDKLSIDGYSQRFITTDQNPNVFQKVQIAGSPTGGTFTLTYQGQTTGPIPFDASASDVQTALEALPNIGPGNAQCILGPVNTQGVVVDLYNDGVPIQLLTGDATNLQANAGTSASISISAVPATITSDQNQLAVGFNAAVRVILDGSIGPNQRSDFPGLTVESDHNIIRGLSIDAFSAGISIQGPGAVGNLVQGNYLGWYLVSPNTSITTATPFVTGVGNGVGVVVDAPSNNSIGNVAPETHNGIAGNVAQGVLLDPGANGNQVVGNLIGVLEIDSTHYFQVGNGAEGILVQSASNLIGGAVAGATNVISANQSYGIHVEGPNALRNVIEANYIGTDINGTFVFGQGITGNGQTTGPPMGNMRDGIYIDDSPDNRIGSPGGSFGIGNDAGNVISGNFGAGVRIAGNSATSNVIQGNAIGTDITGVSALPNYEEGVFLASADNTVGGTVTAAGNLISGNLRGVLVTGAASSGNLIAGNEIGTDGTGAYDLGNSDEGVRIDSASGNTVGGQVASARNLISGNNVGILIVGAGAIGNLVLGNAIGTDATGLLELGNSQAGVEIEGAPANTIGGTSPASTNVISANEWGVIITGPTAISNVVQGNLIGTGSDGLTPLGNEEDGALITNNAANNLIGGLGTGQGNSIGFNIRDGVRLEGVGSVNDGILSNRIFANGGLGIDLVPPGGTPAPPGQPGSGPNNLQNAPALTVLTITSTGVTVQGTLNSLPDTSYLIQFFLSAPGNTSNDGQLVGATTVVTDGSGNASFSVPLPVNPQSGQGILATATDPLNNTSEFSGVVINQPSVLQFSMAIYTVNAAAGLAVITVVRDGGGGEVSISYAVGGGTASPGVDYIPVSGTLVFGLGITVENFTVPILDNLQLQDDKTTNLTLFSPTGGAKLGVPSTAILTIQPDRRDRTQPTVQGVRLITNRHQVVTGIVVTFSKPLNATTATNLLNYGYSVLTPGIHHQFGARNTLVIPIETAVYDPSRLTVTLTLGRGIHFRTPFRFSINESTSVPGAGVGVSDLAGNLLKGNQTNQTGNPYVVILRGKSGGITGSTPRPRAVRRHGPQFVAAVDSAIELSLPGGPRFALHSEDRLARPAGRHHEFGSR